MYRLFLLLTFFSVLSWSCLTDNKKEQPPNIILFFVDDMGWQDTSVPFWTKRTLFNEIYKTPNMERLAKKGVKEIMLIAQDLTYYGLDLYKKRALADLLKELCKVEGIEWIRLHYAYPTGFLMDVMEGMKEEKKICNYLDIPLQHGASNILKAMRRGTSREKTTKLIQDIRAIVPNIAIRTTMIAGYPGETQEDFQEMYDWVEEMKFDRLGIFTYSHEENTHAYNFEDDVPPKLKKEKNQKIEQKLQV